MAFSSWQVIRREISVAANAATITVKCKSHSVKEIGGEDIAHKRPRAVSLATMGTHIIGKVPGKYTPPKTRDMTAS
jgi:hypothetical protein